MDGAHHQGFERNGLGRVVPLSRGLRERRVDWLRHCRQAGLTHCLGSVRSLGTLDASHVRHFRNRADIDVAACRSQSACNGRRRAPSTGRPRASEQDIQDAQEPAAAHTVLPASTASCGRRPEQSDDDPRPNRTGARSFQMP